MVKTTQFSSAKLAPVGYPRHRLSNRYRSSIRDTTKLHYPFDRDLSSGYRYPRFERLGLEVQTQTQQICVPRTTF